MKTSVALLFISGLSLSCFAACPSADLTGDCRVDLADMAVLASQWLDNGVPEPDIAWTQYINDPGVSGNGGFYGYMSKYETTNAQFTQYLNAALTAGEITVSGNFVAGVSGPYSGQYYLNLAGGGHTYNGATNGGASRINWTGSTFTVDPGFEDHPVTYVSWYGATAFADFYGWRLPTEWEWQAVADFNGAYTHGCGTTINTSIANFINSSHPYGTTPVGTFGMYGYGVSDMSGNVWEWTSSANVTERILRGGAWYDSSDSTRVSFRLSLVPNTRYYGFGFRVCR
jgi:formylglycine-generating enzyme required for sulfatase activity